MDFFYKNPDMMFAKNLKARVVIKFNNFENQLVFKTLIKLSWREVWLVYPKHIVSSFKG